MADEAVSAIVLQSNEKEHIGFTLFHPYFAASEGDCVFVIAPKDPDLYDSNEVVTLLKIKERGEHQWLRKGDEVIISFNGIEVLRMYENGTLAHMPSDNVAFANVLSTIAIHWRYTHQRGDLFAI